MKPKTLAAIILIALGIAGFAYQGVTLFTGGRGVSGSMRMTAERTYSVPLAPIFGAIALIGGIAMLLVDKSDFKPAATP
jgi:Ni/Fe-hydrogenase subunit HybB-like protein